MYFPDIYSGQAGIDLKGALAVICKATEGTGYVNPDYARAKANAASHGALFCSYHFLHAGNAAAQAQHAFSVAGHVPLMADFEPTSGSSPQLADAAAFTEEYRRLGGILHLLYLPRWYWQQLGSPDLGIMRSFGMALVSSDYTTYTDADSGPGWQPYGGMTPAVWQYTSTLQWNGFRCDFNAFRGSYAGKQDPVSVAATVAEFRELAATGAWSPAPPPGAWTYGPPRNLAAVAGHESVRLTWDAPDGAHADPAEYQVYVYRGTVCNTRTIAGSYPRTAAASPWQGGGLGRGQLYTAHVVAAGPDGTRVRPYTYASVQFTTG